MSKKEVGNRKKAVTLLVSLFLYAFVLIFVFYEEESFVTQGTVEVKADLGVKNGFEYREVVELEGVEILENLDYTEGVMGVSSGRKPGECGSRFSIERPQLFCDTSDILQNAEVVIAEIYAPAKMFSGSDRPLTNVVQINDRSVSDEDERPLASRNAAETIHSENDFASRMPPGDPSFDDALAEEDKKEAFGMHFGVVGNLSKVDFHSTHKSDCPEVVNRGEFNVKNSNVLQDDLTRLATPPGLMSLGDRDYSGRLCREPTRQYDFTEDESDLLCTEGVLTRIRNFFCENLPTFRDRCDGLEGIVIDAPLGSTEVCNEEDCSIRYWESARLITSPPTDTQNMYPAFLSDSEKREDFMVDDLVVFTTPCKVRVDCKICETKCYWDVSIWQHIFATEEVYSTPDEDNWDNDDWWDSIVEQIRSS